MGFAGRRERCEACRALLGGIGAGRMLSEECAGHLSSCAWLPPCPQVVQLFDSWALHLSPAQYAQFSLPYAQRLVDGVRAQRPGTPLIFHANGGAPLASCETKVAFSWFPVSVWRSLCLALADFWRSCIAAARVMKCSA